MLGETNGTDYDRQLAELKQMYDGYHFSRRKTDIYNPFSLVNVFKTQEIGNYWFDRGTSSALIDMPAQMPPIDMEHIDGICLPSTAFDLPLESFDEPIPFLYQSGYLTIKDCQRIGSLDMYTLGFPNGEVRMGFADCLYRHVTHSRQTIQERSVFCHLFAAFVLLPEFFFFIPILRQPSLCLGCCCLTLGADILVGFVTVHNIESTELFGFILPKAAYQGIHILPADLVLKA